MGARNAAHETYWNRLFTFQTQHPFLFFVTCLSALFKSSRSIRIPPRFFPCIFHPHRK